MYIPLWQRSHVFTQGINFIEYHKVLITILVVIAVIALGAVWHPSGERQILTSDEPLTRLDDPQYAKEYEARAQLIKAQLEKLRSDVQADRAYVVAYKYSSALLANTMELKISKTFEVGLTGSTPQLRDFQDFPRMKWLYLKREELSIGGFVPIRFPRCLGMELYDAQGTPIGYLGIDYLQETSSLRGDERELLQQTAALIEAGLMQPIEYLNSMVQR